MTQIVEDVYFYIKIVEPFDKRLNKEITQQRIKILFKNSPISFESNVREIIPQPNDAFRSTFRLLMYWRDLKHCR